ncbi:serine/threonine-protein kinase [Acrocarpospora catenulata]|uniref:serine/threonine-protein kinase n=1 Tax=Acrocarpospora catenulata TaxID=2836182 RepID=UPI0027E00F40|nr:serine/threonine-protein kinase [Acrocarpospora catenulata]
MTLLAGRYRLHSRIGQGGMGAVWHAVDDLLRQEVAVKEVLLPPELDQAKLTELRERTLREARAAARLRSHPSIVTVHDVVLEDGRPWIVMELVRGQSLQALVQSRGPLPPPRVAAIGATVLDALTAAHGMGILHRDVKPGNVLITDQGRVLLTDFGIASVADDVALTQTGVLSGSPGYMAPERLRGEKDGPLSDLWSLGATLYTAVEGTGAFHRDNSAAVMAAVLMQPPHPMRLAGPLAPVLGAMLEKDPARRCPADWALAQLQAVAGGQATPTPPPPPQYGAQPPAYHQPMTGPTQAAAPRSANRAPVVVGGVLAVALLATAGVVVWNGWSGPASSGVSMSSSPPESSATPSAGSSAPTGRALLTSNPKACSLLTPAQARVLVGGQAEQMFMTADACQWNGPGGAYVQIQKYQYPSEETARLTYDMSRTTAEEEPQRQPGTQLRPGAKAGDAAITWTRDAGSYHQTQMILRTANVTAQLYYSGPRSGYTTIDRFAQLVVRALHKAG